MTLAFTAEFAIEPKRVRQELARLIPIAEFRGLLIYRFYGDDCPHTMNAIGYLREQGFRAVGAGRGAELDLDHRDFGEHSYTQLIAWDPEHSELVAMYRYQLGANAAQWGPECLRTYSLFDYTPAFTQKMLPTGIELGRSVVNRAAKRAKLGFFATWIGLGALTRVHPDTKYFFGNVSLYQSLENAGRDLLVSTMEANYRAPETLLKARPSVHFQSLAAPIRFHPEASAEQRISTLRHTLAEFNTTIPPVLQSYLSLSTAFYCGETVHDADFGDALELGIVVPLSAIDPKIRQRYIGV